MGKIRKRGDTYVIDYYAGGKRHREAIGPVKKEAEAELATILIEIREGRSRGGRPIKPVPVEDAIKRYKRLYAGGKSDAEEETVATAPDKEAAHRFRDKRRYLKLFGDHFRGRILSDISHAEIEDFLAQRKKSPVQKLNGAGEIVYEGPRTAATCNREMATIRHMMNKAVEWGFLWETPCKGIKPLREPKGRVRFLTVDEAATLIEKAKAHLKPVLIMALETGMRKAEILSLRWEDVDSANSSLYVRKTKNGEPRHVPMSERLAAVLKKVPRRVGSSYLFATKKGRPFLDMRTAFENACFTAGIVNFRFHDLRHTAASHLAMAGVPLRAVGEILGHKTPSMTNRYAHLSQEHLKAAVDSLPAWEKAKEEGGGE